MDTISIKAVVVEMVEFDRSNELSELEKQGKVRVSDFSPSIAIHVNDCPRTYVVPSMAKGESINKLFRRGGRPVKVLLTCVVFQDYKAWDYPYFIIKEVKLLEPIK